MRNCLRPLAWAANSLTVVKKCRSSRTSSGTPVSAATAFSACSTRQSPGIVMTSCAGFSAAMSSRSWAASEPRLCWSSSRVYRKGRPASCSVCAKWRMPARNMAIRGLDAQTCVDSSATSAIHTRSCAASKPSKAAASTSSWSPSTSTSDRSSATRSVLHL